MEDDKKPLKYREQAKGREGGDVLVRGGTWLTRAEWDALNDAASAQGISRSLLIKNALNRYFSRTPNKSTTTGQEA